MNRKRPSAVYKGTVSILIPCHNEERMISLCIESCLNQTRKPDQIVVVNDGSTDASQRIIERYDDHITLVNIPHATGNKSRAQEIGLSSITSDVVIATDGDTILDRRFVEHICRDFAEDSSLSVVAGYVQSLRHNTLTALREIDYTIGQDIHKIAQSYVQFLLVVPGCAGAFKTNLFRDGTIRFDHDTLTEDLDFTYKLNRNGLNVTFNRSAKVYTQDPPTINSYINQMRRWYGGAWQNLRKHIGIIKNHTNASFILSLTYFEALITSLTIFILPFINVTFAVQLFAGNVLVCSAMGCYAALRKRRIDLLVVGPLLSVLVVLNAYIFLEQFTKEILLHRKNMAWFHPERQDALGEELTNLMKI